MMKQFFPPNLKLEHDKIKDMLHDEYDGYLKLKKKFSGKPFGKKSLHVYYPGCGTDIVSILLLHDVWLKDADEVHIVLTDFRDFFDGIIFQLQKYTTDSIIKKKKIKGKYYATAKFKECLFHLHYYVHDAMHFLPPELKNNIDIYYERSFEIFRSNDAIGFHRIHANVKKNGLMMSDYGFSFGSYEKNFKKLSGIPSKYGHYKNFQVWQRVEG